MEMRFVDGVLGISVTGPVVRIEFFILKGSGQGGQHEDESLDVQRAPSFSVAMPLEAFANSVSTFENVRKKLVEKGTLSQVPLADRGSPAPTTIHSPNFVQKIS